MLKRGFFCAGFILIAGSVFAASLTADQKYADSKNKFSISYVKGFAQKKSAQGVDFVSADKAVTVTVKVFTAAEAAQIAKKAGTGKADTLVILKAVLDAQKVERDLDPAMNNLPEDIFASAKASAGSVVKYSMKKGSNRFECRTIVYEKNARFVSVGYSILEKKGNEKYEKPAGSMLKSFMFAE